MANNRRIVLTGPESTGKSTLTTVVAEALRLPACLEYARVHLERHGPHYDYGMLLDLSRMHLAYQRAQVPPDAPIGVFDTDLINYKIWCEVVYGRCHPEILHAMEAETTHVYLLCYPDIAWEPDPLRENPDDRERLFARHLAEIERLGRPCRIITGAGEERVAKAIAAARELVGQP